MRNKPMLKILIILYFCCCLFFGMISVWKKWENGLIKTVLITFFPVIGLLLVLYLFKPIKVHPATENTNHLEMADFSFPVNQVNVEKEINFVPIQDALLLNDNQTKRKLLIHSLKENSIQNTSILTNALQNEDTETSHYAATAIMEMKRKLQNSLQEFAEKLERK